MKKNWKLTAHQTKLPMIIGIGIQITNLIERMNNAIKNT
jgi:transposase-like protein